MLCTARLALLRKRVRSFRWCTVIWATHLGLAHAETLSLREAMDRTGSSPSALAGRRALQTAQDGVQNAPALDANPMITGSLGPRIAPTKEQGVEAQLGVYQSLSLDGAATKRTDALKAEASWLRVDLAQEALSRRLAAARAWFALWEGEQLLTLALRNQASETELEGLVQRLARAGERTTVDVATASARRADADLQVLNAEGLMVEAQAKLRAEVHAKPGTDLSTDKKLPEFDALSGETRRRLAAAAEALPAVRTRILWVAAERARAEEDRASRGSRISVGAELRRDALQAVMVQANISVPLPLFAVGDREHTARLTAAQRGQGEVEDQALRVRASIDVLLHELDHTTEVYDHVKGKLVPAATQAVVLHQRQLAVGEGTLLELIDARRTLVLAEQRHIQAQRDLIETRLRATLLLRAIAP